MFSIHVFGQATKEGLLLLVDQLLGNIT